MICVENNKVRIKSGVCSCILSQPNEQHHPHSDKGIYFFPLRSGLSHSADKATDKASLNNVLCCSSLFDVKTHFSHISPEV